MDEVRRRPRGSSALGDFEQSKRSAMETVMQEKIVERAKSERLRFLREARGRYGEPENIVKEKDDQ